MTPAVETTKKVVRPGECCTWHTCQRARVPGVVLCTEHVALSAVLGLKVWPA